MKSDRIRSALGLWVPLALGLWIIATAFVFYFTADLSSLPGLESWRLVCSAGVVFVGGLMILSTFGRYRRAKAASPAAPPKT
jgi:hypothetical protein